MPTDLELPPASLKSGNSAPRWAQIGLFSSTSKRTVILSLLLFLLTVGLYNSVVHNGFINLDDNLYVTDNPNVKAGLHWTSVKWALTTCEQANWHPLTWLSHALDWQLFNKNAGGHHYVSLLWHAMDAVLLFLLLQSATGFTWRSWIVAALFAVHPANVESVAWVAERKNVLSMFFFLLAMLVYGWYARRPSLRRYSLVPLLFALGLMAKPQVITLPCVLLLWDYWPLQRFGSHADGATEPAFARASFSRLVLEKTPLFLLAAADAVITMYAQRRGLAVRTFEEYSLYGRLGNCIVAYARYVGHCFWPFHLSPSYSHPGNAIPLWQVVLSSVFLVCATAFVLASRKRYLQVGWLWFLGTLVPMIGIVQVGDQAMADRYAYIPFLGLFWMATWGISEASRAWHMSRRWLAVPACLSLLTLALLSQKLVSYWHDSEALWDYALTVDHDDFMAHMNRGRILILENRPQEAIREFQIAQAFHQYPAGEVLRFAGYEMRFGHSDDAAARCRKVLETTQDPHMRAIAWTDLGVANMTLNKLPEAKDAFEQALQADPATPGAILGMGIMAERRGDFEGAVASFNRALKMEPNDLGYFLLATALEKSGRKAEASDAFAQAQRLSPNLKEVVQRAHELLP